MHKNRKFKNYFLFPRIQFKFIAITLLSLALTIGFVIYQINSSFNHLLVLGQKVGLSQDAGYFRLLKAQEQIIFKNLIIAFVLGTLISLIINFIVTHRALGPFYRIKKFFSTYKHGSGEKIIFRKSDYFKDLEGDINQALGHSEDSSSK